MPQQRLSKAVRTMAEIISGKEISEKMRRELKEKVSKYRESGDTIGLAVIIVGDDGASKIYVRNKRRACLEVGIESFEYDLPESTSESELLSLISKLNSDSRINGILCQLPLPPHINEKNVINAIDPKKDVDAFHPINTGRILTGDYGFLPCTPAGVIEMLKAKNIAIEGKNCVIVGRSNIVGKPLALMLLKENATVTVCHSKTADLKSETLSADILVAATGKAGLIKEDMVKPGAVVIDVGINRDENGKLCGDVDFSAVEKKASFITPVPGGVGPMTITMLLENTVRAYEMTKYT